MFDFLFGSSPQVASAERRIHPPTGSGTGEGRAFYFCFGLPETNAGELLGELEGIQHDIEALTDHGYRVILEPAATRASFEAALYNEDPDLDGTRTMGLLWSSHGDENGRIQTVDDDWLAFQEIDAGRLSPLLSCLVFSACHVGRYEEGWKQALGGARIYGWGKPVSFQRARDFYVPDGNLRTRLDGILERELSLPDGVIREAYRRRQGAPVPSAPLPSRGAGLDFEGLQEMTCEALDALQLPHGDLTRDAEVLSVRLHFDDGRSQNVNLFLGEGIAQTERYQGDVPLVFVESYVGPWSGIVDDGELLSHNTKLQFGHILIHQGDGEETLFVKGGMDSSVVTAPLLAAVMEEIAIHGDLLEEALFGCDED